MIRCCLCRKCAGYKTPDRGIEPTDLPGTGYRCADHDACRERVRATIAAHVGLAEVCEPQPLGDHPYNDPGGGRTECDVCGKWVFECIHSCKRVPVTDAAWARWHERQAAQA